MYGEALKEKVMWQLQLLVKVALALWHPSCRADHADRQSLVKCHCGIAPKRDNISFSNPVERIFSV
jgi:hypothetical protein